MAQAPVTSGGEPMGAVSCWTAGQRGAPARLDVLNVVAIAVVTELAVADVREETDSDAQLADRPDPGNPELSDEDLLRRAYRVGSDLGLGAWRSTRIPQAIASAT